MSRLIARLIVGCALTAAAQAQDTQDILRPRAGVLGIGQIVMRIRTDADSLRLTVDLSGPRVDVDGRSKDDLYNLIDDLLRATDHLADHLDRRQVIRVDVEDVMWCGTQLANATDGRRSSLQTRNSWTRLQRDLDSLASAFGVNWDWRSPAYSPIDSVGNVYQRLLERIASIPRGSRTLAVPPIGR